MWIITSICWADWPVIWDSSRKDVLEGIAIDLTGNVVGAGWNRDVTGSAVWQIRKYDPDGNLLWHQQYHSSGDICTSLSVDLVGNIFVGGYWQINGAIHWRIAKYRPDGYCLWNNGYLGGGGIFDGLFAVASGMWSNYHVAVGFAWYYMGYLSPRVVKVDGDGNVVWNKILADSLGGFFWDVTILQETGEIIAGGTLPTRGGGGLIKFDGNGNEVFTIIYPDSALADSCMCRAVARRTTGFFALYESQREGPMYYYDLVRYDDAGYLLWKKTVSVNAFFRQKIDMELDLNCDIWIPMGSYILRYDTLGNRLDSIPSGMNAVVCRPDTFDNIFIGGMINDPADWIIDRIDPIGIEEIPRKIFSKTFQIHPNPFIQKTIISFMIPDIEDNISDVVGQNATLIRGRLSLRIYDATGRLVKSFNRTTPDASPSIQIVWDGSDDFGHQLPAGVYFVQFEAEDYKQTEKVILLR